MGLWLLEAVPHWLMPFIIPVVLVVFGYLLEPHYTSRPGMFLNWLALANVFAYVDVPPAFQWYMLVSGFIGISAIVAWASGTRCTQNFYAIGLLSNGSLTAGGMLLWGVSTGIV